MSADRSLSIPRVFYHWLPDADYADTWALQTQWHEALKAAKRARREAEKTGAPLPDTEPQHQLLFVEHKPVYTLGKSGSMDHLLLDEEALSEQGFHFFRINRGGDITYHGPGQLVVYPILDLDAFFNDVHRYVRLLEEVIIQTLADFGLKAVRETGYTGVWLPASAHKPKRKICAIGVHLSRWVSMHGLAFNVDPNLSHFDHIVPCGIQEDDRSVTSLSKELGRPVRLSEVMPSVRRHFCAAFNCRLDFSADNNHQNEASAHLADE